MMNKIFVIVLLALVSPVYSASNSGWTGPYTVKDIEHEFTGSGSTYRVSFTVKEDIVGRSCSIANEKNLFFNSGGSNGFQSFGAYLMNAEVQGKKIWVREYTECHKNYGQKFRGLRLCSGQDICDR